MDDGSTAKTAILMPRAVWIHCGYCSNLSLSSFGFNLYYPLIAPHAPSFFIIIFNRNSFFVRFYYCEKWCAPEVSSFLFQVTSISCSNIVCAKAQKSSHSVEQSVAREKWSGINNSPKDSLNMQIAGSRSNLRVSRADLARSFNGLEWCKFKWNARLCNVIR